MGRRDDVLVAARRLGMTTSDVDSDRLELLSSVELM